MPARLKYGLLAPEALQRMQALEHYLSAGTALEHGLLGMVRLRVSQMNGCEYCVQLHTTELRNLKESDERIAAVAGWRETGVFTERERAALGWAEALTNIQDGHAPDAVYAAVRAEFTEVETANLTFVITTINSWNRVAIGLGNYPGHSGPVAGR